MSNAKWASDSESSRATRRNATRDVAFRHEQTLGGIQQETELSELNPIQGWVATPYVSSSRPFCVRFNAGIRQAPYTYAETLDTGPLAKRDPVGSHPRSSANDF